MGYPNGYDNGFMDLKELLETIAAKAENQMIVLDEVRGLQLSQGAHLEAIARNTESMVEVLKEQKRTETELVQIASGKKQVPLVLMLAVVVLWGVQTLVVLLDGSGLNVSIPYLGIEIRHAEAK